MTITDKNLSTSIPIDIFKECFINKLLKNVLQLVHETIITRGYDSNFCKLQRYERFLKVN